MSHSRKVEEIPWATTFSPWLLEDLRCLESIPFYGWGEIKDYKVPLWLQNSHNPDVSNSGSVAGFEPIKITAFHCS